MAKANISVLSRTVDCKTEEDLMKLAKAIKDKFPTGKMGDGVTYWKQSPRDIHNKLLRFFEDWDDDYTVEEILQATDNYIKSFANVPNHKGMRCSKYFILKFDKVSGEWTSDLSTMLTHLRDGETVENKSSWLDELS